MIHIYYGVATFDFRGLDSNDFVYAKDNPFRVEDIANNPESFFKFALLKVCSGLDANPMTVVSEVRETESKLWLVSFATTTENGTNTESLIRSGLTRLVTAEKWNPIDEAWWSPSEPTPYTLQWYVTGDIVEVKHESEVEEDSQEFTQVVQESVTEKAKEAVKISRNVEKSLAQKDWTPWIILGVIGVVAVGVVAIMLVRSVKQ